MKEKKRKHLPKDYEDLETMYRSDKKEDFDRRKKYEDHMRKFVHTPMREDEIHDFVDTEKFNVTRIPEDWERKLPDFYIEGVDIYLEATGYEESVHPPPNTHQIKMPSETGFISKLNDKINHIEKKEKIYNPNGIIGGLLHFSTVFIHLSGFSRNPDAMDEFIRKTILKTSSVDFLIVTVDNASNMDGTSSRDNFPSKIYISDNKLRKKIGEVFPGIPILLI